MGHTQRMAPLEAFAKRIRKLRGPLTQAELARRAGISRSFLARIEVGLQEPTLSTIEKLARALRMKPAQLFEDELSGERRPKHER